MPQGRTSAVARELDAPSTSKGGSAFTLSTTETHRQRFENSWGGCADPTREARTKIAKDALRSLHHARVRFDKLVWRGRKETPAFRGREIEAPNGGRSRLGIGPRAAVGAGFVHAGLGSRW